MYSNELQHFGIKGQKWGVRRYQNKDGTLTEAGKKRLSKDLTKDYRRGYNSAQPFKTSEKYNKRLRETIDGAITDEDKKLVVAAKKRWLSNIDAIDKAETELDDLARKYGRDEYDKELQKNPDAYDTPRAKEKLMEYCVYELGSERAQKERPDLVKIMNSSDALYDSYVEECRKVSDKILGNYGNTKLYDCKYYSLTIRDTVGDMVSSMSNNDNWK